MDVKELIDILEDRNVFITGGGGVGKSHTIKLLQKELPIVLTASTGISAVNIEGQTIHSWSGIGIGNLPIEYTVKFLHSPKGKSKLKEICDAKYLVIDEISMLNSYILDYLNEVFKRVRGNNLAFGGIRVIAVGDMFQLPPVKIGEFEKINGAERYIDFCFNASAWQELDFKVILLDKVYRQDDKNFIETLNNIRLGNCSDKDENLLRTRNFPDNYEIPNDVVKLYSVNEKADAENERRFKELDGKVYKFHAVDLIRAWIDGDVKMVSPNNSKLQSWDINKYKQFDDNCRVPKLLELKMGARVMLLKNTDFENALVNGSCGNVTDISYDAVKVKFDNGVETWIREDTIELKEGKYTKISRSQIPLRLAYSCTVHKIQGLTFDKVFVDFARIFAAGQAYVALSRVKSLDGLYIKHFNKNCIFADDKVKEFYRGLK